MNKFQKQFSCVVLTQGYLMRLYSRCQPELQSSESLTGARGSTFFFFFKASDSYCHITYEEF